jgi:hypothetical protein
MQKFRGKFEPSLREKLREFVGRFKVVLGGRGRGKSFPHFTTF